MQRAQKQRDQPGGKGDLQSGKNEKVIGASPLVVVADGIGQPLTPAERQRFHQPDLRRKCSHEGTQPIGERAIPARRVELRQHSSILEQAR